MSSIKIIIFDKNIAISSINYLIEKIKLDLIEIIQTVLYFAKLLKLPFHLISLF